MMLTDGYMASPSALPAAGVQVAIFAEVAFPETSVTPTCLTQHLPSGTDIYDNAAQCRLVALTTVGTTDADIGRPRIVGNQSSSRGKSRVHPVWGNVCVHC